MSTQAALCEFFFHSHVIGEIFSIHSYRVCFLSVCSFAYLSEPSFGLRFAMGGRISIFLIRIMGVSFGAGLASGLIVFAPALLPFSSAFSEGPNSVAEFFGCPASVCILAVLSRRFSPGESTLTRGVDNCDPGNSLKAHPIHLKCKRGGE